MEIAGNLIEFYRSHEMKVRNFVMKSLKMQFLRTGAVLMALGLGSVSAFAGQNIRSVRAKEFHDLIEKKDGVVLDVRTDEEVKKGKIAKSVELDFYRKDFLQNLEVMDRRLPVYVYCRSGSRSMNTSKLLDGLGFETIVNLDGGINSWKSAGLPIEVAESYSEQPSNMDLDDSKKLETALAGAKPVLVDFYAEWCGPCQTMKPVVNGIAEEYSERATVLKIDVDENADMAREYGVKAIPLFIVFKEGEEVWRGKGVVDRDVLLTQLSLN